MRVLFISRSKKGVPSPIIYNQGESIKNLGAFLDYFLIENSGLIAYLRSIYLLNKLVKSNKYSIFHAHYSFSGFVAAFSRAKPLVVSLMGSDVKAKKWYRLSIKTFNSLFWDVCIVKTSDMKDTLKTKKVQVIPNGVNLNTFKIMDKLECRKELNLNNQNKIILFIADPSRSEKNYPLAVESVKLLNRKDVILLPVYDVHHSLIPKYLNAADLLLLTSIYEGSVNVVKEAMACSIPIVSTDTGDVKHNISDIDGCYISDSTARAVSSKIKLALTFNGRTKGREKLLSLGLDSLSVANKLIRHYESLLKE